MSNTPERTVTKILHRPALAVEVAAHLVIVEGNNIGKAYLLAEQATIGRSPDATFPLEDPSISRFHVRVSRHPSGFVLQDLNSHNGTFINGERLKGHRLLQFGDKIGLGSSITLMFVYRDLIDEQMMLSQKMESMGRLAGGIAHDFNNILGAMISGLEFALDLPQERLATDTRDCLRDVLAAARRATDLTRQLLGFARQGKHQPASFDLSDLVREVLQLLQRTFDPAITIESDITPGICVVGDASQLHQVVMNLCLNARDAMSHGGTLQLELSATEVQPRDVPPPQVAGRYATLVVTDTGHGMDEATHSQAFEPFFTTKAPGFGTGLGLSTVHGIVARHGGWIRLESEPHAGCRFWVYLPLSDDDPGDRPPDGSGDRPPGDKPASTELGHTGAV